MDSVANRALIVSPSGEKAIAGVMTRIAASAVATKATFCRTLDQKNNMTSAIAQLPQAARTSDSSRPMSEKTIDPQRIRDRVAIAISADAETNCAYGPGELSVEKTRTIRGIGAPIDSSADPRIHSASHAGMMRYWISPYTPITRPPQTIANMIWRAFSSASSGAVRICNANRMGSAQFSTANVAAGSPFCNAPEKKP